MPIRIGMTGEWRLTPVWRQTIGVSPCGTSLGGALLGGAFGVALSGWRFRGVAGKDPGHILPQRIGGAYCSPPFDQMLLMPRGTPIGVMLRSHTSPKLPTDLITL
jgi:hypothetical protein